MKNNTIFFFSTTQQISFIHISLRNWAESIIPNIIDTLAKEFPLPGDAPGGMILYRRSLTLRYTLSVYYEILMEQEKY